MKRLAMALVMVVPLGLIVSCSSPEERAAKSQQRAYEAQEDLVKERLRLVEQYRECVTASSGDDLKLKACDSYLKSAEALK